MTSYYIYAILPRGVDLPTDLRGFHGSPLETVDVMDLTAVVASQDDEAITPTAERVQAHHEVVTALRRVGPAIPVRFGTILQNAEALRDALVKQRDALISDIERLAGKVEFGITTLWGDALDGLQRPDPPGRALAGPGADYMWQRLAEVQWEDQLRELAETLQETMDERFAGLSEDTMYHVLPSPKIPLRLRCLVEARKSAEFEVAFAELRRQCAEFKFSLVGPWPPYSFVTSGAEEVPGTHAAKYG